MLPGWDATFHTPRWWSIDTIHNELDYYHATKLREKKTSVRTLGNGGICDREK